MYGANESGTMVVTGTWTPQLATFIMNFTGVESEGEPILVVGIGSLTVAPMNTTHLIIAYGEEDILVAPGNNAGGGINEASWAVSGGQAGDAQTPQVS